MNVAGGRGLLGQLVAELLTVLGAALNREETHQHWHPPRCVSHSLFAPGGEQNQDKTSKALVRSFREDPHPKLDY